MVLAGLEQVHIRALFSQTSAAVSLRSVALEVAGEVGGGPPASNVELCMCPANYRGDSCQVRSVGGTPPLRSVFPTPPSPTGYHPPSSPAFLPWAGPLHCPLYRCWALCAHSHSVSLHRPVRPGLGHRSASPTTWWGGAHLSQGIRVASGALPSCLAGSGPGPLQV